jgi:hypothetical protein
MGRRWRGAREGSPSTSATSIRGDGRQPSRDPRGEARPNRRQAGTRGYRYRLNVHDVQLIASRNTTTVPSHSEHGISSRSASSVAVGVGRSGSPVDTARSCLAPADGEIRCIIVSG